MPSHPLATTVLSNRSGWHRFLISAILSSLFSSSILAFSVTPTTSNSHSMDQLRSDKNMEQTYDDLARRALDAYDRKGAALWVACVGGPGAGKTTLASAVATRICKLAKDLAPDQGGTSSDIPIEAVAIPMDGYHYTKKRLAELAQPDDVTKGMSRRGAPWTFDAEGLAVDLAKAKSTGRASLPEYSRVISDPVPDSIKLEDHHKIVLVEGNYLLLGSLLADLDKGGTSPKPQTELHETCKTLDCPTSIGDEIRRWEAVASLFDETWFIAPPDGVEEQRRRLIERSLETWTAEKTLAWGGGTDREAATGRADFNDVRNARLVECCRPYSSLVIDSI